MKKILMGFIFLTLMGSAIAQNITVKGKVTSDKGEPIAGASIQVKSSTTGAIAGIDGSFTIAAKKVQN